MKELNYISVSVISAPISEKSGVAWIAADKTRFKLNDLILLLEIKEKIEIFFIFLLFWKKIFQSGATILDQQPLD